MKNLFSILLLLSFAGVQAEDVNTIIAKEVAYNDNVIAFAKEAPGNLFIATKKVDLEELKSQGYDGVILDLEKHEEESKWTKVKHLIGTKTYTIILFDTDAKEDIVDWLAA